MMEYLQNLADGSSWPILTAFLLGLMTAISPCPLATNITATAYLSKDIGNKRRVLFNGVFYTLGRMFTYTALGLIFYFGASQFQIAKLLQGVGGMWLGIALVIIGVLMLDVIKLGGLSTGKLTEKLGRKKENLPRCLSARPVVRAGILSLQRSIVLRRTYPHDNSLAVRPAPAARVRHSYRPAGYHYRVDRGVQRR